MCLRSRSHKPSLRNLPINSVSISGRLEGLALLLECEYSYTNTLSKERIEVEFVFPIPPGAVVCGLSGEIDGREVKGVVKGKELARDEYDDAISSGYSAGFAETLNQNDFRLLLGNLSPNGRAVLRIKLLSELELNTEGIASLRLPAAMLPQCQFKFDLLIEKRVGEFSRIESRTHSISYSKEATGEVVRVKEAPESERRDLVLLLKPSFTDLPHISTFPPLAAPASTLDPPHHYLTSHMCMLTFIPQLATEPGSEPPAEFIFIIDRSGSMSGSRMKHAKSTLELLLQSLTIGCYFNIIGFGSEFELLSDGQSLEYNQESLERSLQYVRKMEANFGGTYLLSPLRAALQLPQPQSGLSRQIMLLTDGETEGVSEIIEMVRSTPQTFRVFSFGIGGDASQTLVGGVASAGRGKAVYLEESSEMEQEVLRILNLAFSPDLRDIHLEFSHPTRFFPGQLPNLFLNERLVVYGFISGPAPAQLEAKLSFTKEGERVVMRKKFSLSDPDTVSPSQDGISLVHLLGCSRALRSWESDASMRSESVQLSCATGVLCQHTAYIAVDSNQSAPINAPLVTLPATATSRMELLMSNRISINNTNNTRLMKRKRRSRNKSYLISRKKTKTSISRDRSRSRSRSPVPGRCAGVRGKKKSRAKAEAVADIENEDRIIAQSQGLPSSDEDDDDSAQSQQSKDSIEYKPVEFRDKKLEDSIKTPASYQGITRLQRADGSWEHSAELDKELQLDISGTCPPGLNLNLNLWSSILCIVCLKVAFSQFQTQLLLVVRKGESWVKRELSESAQKISYEELTDSARQILSL